MNIKMLSVDQIDDRDRLRSVDPIYVAELAASFKERGAMMTPIEVRRVGDGYKLVAGAHRLAAARDLRWKTIGATLFEGSETEATLREIDENLVRRDLTALDRARFVQKREELWAAAHPGLTAQEIAANCRWHATKVTSFASDAAKKLGVSSTTIRAWITLAEAVGRLSPQIKARIQGSDLANRQSELLDLCDLPSDVERNAALDLLLSNEKGRPTTVIAAHDKARGALPEHVSKDQGKFDTFVRAWTKYSPDLKELVRDYVISQQKSAEKAAKRRAVAA